MRAAGLRKATYDKCWLEKNMIGMAPRIKKGEELSLAGIPETLLVVRWARKHQIMVWYFGNKMGTKR